jgi:N-acetylmuramoyl-L-alanine amidase-like protein
MPLSALNRDTDAGVRRRAVILLALLAALLCAGCGATRSIVATRASSLGQPPSKVAGSSPGGVAPPGGSPQTPPSGPTPAPTPPSPSSAPAVPAPRVISSPIPFPASRKAEMTAYAHRHYGLDTYRLTDPHVIVIHFTESPDFSSTYNTFAPDHPDSELHELPNTCAHYVIDKAGVIHQLVPLQIMCRHTVGLNWTAIGIEHVGYSDQEVLSDSREMAASLRLVRWLRCHYKIAVGNVIGHNESLSSPYHRENVPSLRTQTHSDFQRADMQVYRRRLRTAGPCPAA